MALILMSFVSHNAKPSRRLVLSAAYFAPASSNNAAPCVRIVFVVGCKYSRPEDVVLLSHRAVKSVSRFSPVSCGENAQLNGYIQFLVNKPALHQIEVGR